MTNADILKNSKLQFERQIIMKVRVSSKLRGVLAIPGTKITGQANEEISIDDATYWGNDFQAAIRKGFLVAVEKIPVDPNNVIKIRNVSKKIMNFASISQILEAGELIYVSKDVLMDSGIVDALTAGLIRLEGSESKDILAKSPPPPAPLVTIKKEQSVAPVVIEKEIDPVEGIITGNKNKKKKTKAKKKGKGNITVKKGSDGNTMVAWNPTNDTQSGIKGAVVATGHLKLAVSQKDGSLKKMPTKADPLIFDPSEVEEEENEMDFADKKIEQEKIMKNPALRKIAEQQAAKAEAKAKPIAAQNSEIDFGGEDDLSDIS